MAPHLGHDEVNIDIGVYLTATPPRMRPRPPVPSYIANTDHL